MIVVVVLVLAAALASCKDAEPAPTAHPTSAPEPAPVARAAPPPPTAAGLVNGPLPGGPEGELARGRCVICHGEDYLVQQRLSPEAWTKTVAKMQKFGAPMTDDEATRIAAWLATLYAPALPTRPATLVELPAAGLPPGM